MKAPDALGPGPGAPAQRRVGGASSQRAGVRSPWASKRRAIMGVAILTAASAGALAAVGAGAAQEPAPIRAGVAPPPGVYAPGVDVVHYDVEVGLGLTTDWFAGRAVLRVAASAAAPVLPLDFTGLEVTSVTLGKGAADYTYEEGVLRVPLRRAEPGDTVEVAVAYRGVPDDGLILAETVHGDPSAFVDNWPNRTRFWLPSVDHPTDKATIRYTVHAPTAWRVVANGHLVRAPAPTPRDAIGPEGERRTWIWDVGVPISPYNMVIGAADFEVRTVGLAACGQAPASPRDDGCVEVTYWVFPEDVERAEPSFRRAADMVDYFAELVGPFPFAKLANVQSATRFGGMENASAIFYSQNGIAEGRNIEGTVSHEIAHQWFGDAVTQANWHHLWLSEGFATYFGAVFFEHADGVAAFRERMERSRRSVVESDDADRPVVDPAERDLFALLNDNNYAKGGWVLHMLRGLLGDEAFFAGIREYYRRHLHENVLTDDLRVIMEDVSGRDLEWFFHQWIHEPGYPVFEVDEAWTPAASSAGGTLRVTVRQVQKPAWPTFRVPLELLVRQDGHEIRREVEVRERETVVRFDLEDGGRPDEVLLDPDVRLLAAVR